MSILSKFKDTGEAEVQAEIDMISDVLYEAGISSGLCPRDFNNPREQRTFLISQLKHVPSFIKNLRIERTQLKLDLNLINELLESVQKKEIELLDENKKLREENEFLRNTKEKIYILRGMR